MPERAFALRTMPELNWRRMPELLHGMKPRSLVMARVSWRHLLLLSLSPHAYAAVFLRPAYGNRATSVSLRAVTRRLPSVPDTALWYTSSFDTSLKNASWPRVSVFAGTREVWWTILLNLPPTKLSVTLHCGSYDPATGARLRSRRVNVLLHSGQCQS